MKHKCGNCAYWVSYHEYYEDEEEPTDFGFCECDKSDESTTSDDDWCEYWVYWSKKFEKGIKE